MNVWEGIDDRVIRDPRFEMMSLEELEKLAKEARVKAKEETARIRASWAQEKK